MDTNVFVHGRIGPIAELPWLELSAGRVARVVVPLIVVQELDRLKFDTRRPDLAKTARRALRQLDAWFVQQDGHPAQLAPDVTVGPSWSQPRAAE